MAIVNLTPYTIRIFQQQGWKSDMILRPSGVVARAPTIYSNDGRVDVALGVFVEVVRKTLGRPTDLPEPRPGTYYIVSADVAKAATEAGRDMSDLLFPDDSATGNVVDEMGRTVMGAGYWRLLRVA